MTPSPATPSSQKFLARHRAPRVQIEYDVELYGSSRKVQIPFVVGVMAPLTGQPESPPVPLAERSFLEIDIDNFDDRLKSLRPRIAFQVPDTLSGHGALGVDLRFESLDDFAPDAVARRVAPLRHLLEARTRLKDLLTYMDGKVDAEAIVAALLADPGLQACLARPPADPPGETACAPSAAPAEDGHGRTA